MEHIVKVIAYSKEVGDNGVSPSELSSELDVLSGRAAGICYMPDKYMISENGYKDTEKAKRRANSTASRGHHSIFDHGYISYIITTSKMMAIVLNSLGVYTTSEKSARYTAMKANTPEEQEKYDKWKIKIRKAILDNMPSIDDSMIKARLLKALELNETTSKLNIKAIDMDVKAGCAIYGIEYESIKPIIDDIMSDIKESCDLPSCKLAQENARYMLSVFTPTVLQYTMSYRQTALVVDYFDKFYAENKNNVNNFYRKVALEAKELSKQFKSQFESLAVHDIKNQCLRLMPDTHGTGKHNKKDCLCDSYTVNYMASFAALAQEVRHRTLRYSFELLPSTSDTYNQKYYVPKIVKVAGLSSEWLEDIKSLESVVPQGTLVKCTEQGLVEDFALKCKERCCSRAQLEVAEITKETLEKFGKEAYQDSDNLCESNKDLIKSMVEHNEFTGAVTAKPRCKFCDFKCTDKCTFGSKKCFDRLV